MTQLAREPDRSANGGLLSSTSRIAWIGLLIVQMAILLLRSASAAGLTTRIWATDLLADLDRPTAIVVILATFVAAAFTFAAASRWRGAFTRRASAVGLACCLVSLCLLLPDRSGFLGDFLLRRGALNSFRYAETFPQTLPLDRLLIGGVVGALGALTRNLDAVARAFGLLGYAALLLVAGLRAGEEPTDELPPVARIALVGATGLACIFTGFTRDTVLFLPLSLALYVSLSRRVTLPDHCSPHPEWLLLALLALHRSAAFLLLPYAYATLVAVPRWSSGVRRSAWKASLGMLALGVVALIPLYARIGSTFDLSRHAAWLVAGRPADLPGLSIDHLGNVACALIVLSPMALGGIGLFVSGLGRRERGFHLSIALCWLPMLLFVTPQQGVFRDLDVYAGAALAYTFIAIRAVSSLRRSAPRLGSLVLGTSFVSGFQGMLALLLVATNPAATRARITDALARYPAAPATIRAQWLDWLVDAAQRRADDAEAARLAAESARLIPTPLRLIRAGLATAGAGDYQSARGFFGQLVSEDSTSAVGWTGIAGMSAALGESSAVGTVLQHVQGLARRPLRRANALRFLGSSPVVDPTGFVRRSLLDRDSTRSSADHR